MAEAERKRIAGRQLQRIRRSHFAEKAMCVRCWHENRFVLATQLDHIIPFHKGGADTLDPFENRQGLCDECHLDKTAEDMGHLAIGCDADGNPTDPRHPWVRAERFRG